MNSHNFPLISDPIIHIYCEKYSSYDGGLLDIIKEKTEATGKSIMLSNNLLGQYLKMMSMILQPKVILELGTFTGYGALCLSQGLQSDGKVYTIESSDIHYEMAKDHLKDHLDQIEIIKGDGLEEINKLQKIIDLVFVDAAKRQYIKYYEAIIPKLRSGGVILADNVLWKGKVVTDQNDSLGKGLDAFNKHVAQDARVENVILPIDDGVNFIIKK